MRHAAVPCLAALVLAACGDLPHDNPHDPQAPTDTQGRAALSGTVTLEPPGASAPSFAGVHASVAGQSWAADSDADGHYRISGVPVGTWTIQFTRAGWDDVTVPGITVTLDDAGGTIPLSDVRLPVSRGNVTGRIVLESEASAGGVNVALDGADLGTTTDLDGRFVLAGVPVGTYALTARKSGFRDGQVGAVSVTASGVTLLDDLTLYVNPGAFAGQVLVAGAASSGGVTVRATGTTLNGSPWESTTTNRDDGSYLLSGIPAGLYEVSFERAGYRTVQAPAVARPGDVTDLAPVTLEHDVGALQGVATLDDHADPASIQVVLRPDLSSPVVAAAVTDAAGAWRMETVPVGAYTVVFSRAGYAGQTAPASVSSHLVGRVDPVVLAALPGALRGRVVLEGGAAPTGVTVRLEGTTVSTVTLTDGSWTLDRVAAGAHTVAFERTGFDALRIQVATVAGGDLRLADVTLAISRGAIEGTVTLSPGSVVGFPNELDGSGTTVSLSGNGLPATVTVTDSTGHYRFTGVPAAAGYALTATRPGYTQAAPVAVSVPPSGTVTAPAIPLQVSPGALSGTVQLRDGVGGSDQPNPSSAGAAVSVTGLTFAGGPWTSTTVTAASGAFTVANLPKGTYDVTVTSPGRTCDAFARTAAAPGAATALGTVQCKDVVAPGALALGAPEHASNALAGYTNQLSVVVPIATPATDATAPMSNLRGYQVAVGATPSWSGAPVSDGAGGKLIFALPSPTRPDSQRFTLWARAVDWLDNAGPATSVDVVYDGVPPATPTLTTPRTLVNATSAAVALLGAEGDANFLRYEVKTAPCPGGVATCDFVPSTANLAVSLAADQATVISVRAIDRAGNASGVATLRVTSDLTPPQPPLMAPRFDASRLTVRAQWVDFVPSTPAYDPPATATPGWTGVGHLEVDTGTGFSPLCGAAACVVSGAWSPCTCGCGDARLVCDGSRFVGVRAPLTGASTTVAFRAVDLAGNTGPSTSQEVRAQSAAEIVASGNYLVGEPVLRGRLLAYASHDDQSNMSLALLDLGADRRLDTADERCTVVANVVNSSAGIAVLSDDAIAYGATGDIWLRRRGQTGRWCAFLDETLLSRGTNVSWSAAGDAHRVAWVERSASPQIEVREAGPDGAMGTLDDPRGVVAGTGFSSVQLVGLAGRTLLMRYTNPGAFTVRVVSAGPSGSFLSGTTVRDLGASTSNNITPVLSRDGTTVAWKDPTDWSKVDVFQAGVDGVFGSADDRQVVLAAGESLGETASLALEPGRIVVVEGGAYFGEGRVVEWQARADGQFDPRDLPTFSFPSTEPRSTATLDGGLLVYQGTRTLEALDLSTLRWDLPLLTGVLSEQNAVSADSGGAVYWVDGDRTVHARTAAGHESVRALGGGHLAAAGPNAFLATTTYGTLMLFTPSAAGDAFGNFVAVRTTPLARSADAVVAGGGKAIVAETERTSFQPVHPVILEPGSGTLGTFPTTGTAVEAYPATCGYTGTAPSLGITARQALFSCPGSGTGSVVMVQAGPDGRFAAGASATHLLLPDGTYPGTTAVFQLDGPRLVLSDSSRGTYLLDAGADGLYGTADDSLRRLTARPVSLQSKLAVAGDWAAWVDIDASGSEQVFLMRGLDGSPRQVTTHRSTKDDLTLDPSGQVRWVDSATTPRSLMVYRP